MDQTFEKVVALAKRRGFIFPGSEIYGGLANTYDYGPMGVELMRNIRNMFWDTFVHKRTDMVGLDASLISHQEIWKASGHVSGFSDALVDCKNCKVRIRADHLIEDALGQKVEGLDVSELTKIIKDNKIPCPSCKKSDWTDARKFNLLFPVHMGIVEGEQSLAYLRGETAQGMFINFKNILDSTRVKPPFGIAQIGKSFRNEITPGNSVFRTLVFEQAEIEYFFDPETDDWNNLFEDWKSEMFEFINQKIGIKSKNLRWREHTDEERSFYSKRTEDLEYNYPFGGFKELWGLAYRTDYDLSQHEKFSGKELRVVDSQTGKKILPHVIEPAVGVDRIFLMALCDAYSEEGDRVILKLKPALAPVKVAVFPLLANKEELVIKARDLYSILKSQIHGFVFLDERGNIGKRYLSQDEIGTPFCVTVDFDTLVDESVTVRDRDSGEQTRIKIIQLTEYLQSKLV